MRVLLILVASALAVSCGSAVAIDYDQQTDFGTYKTYNYFPNLQTGLNELDNKRIIAAMDSLLQQRGFIKENEPQLYINFFANESISNSRNTIGIGIGGGGRNVGVGVSGGIPIGGHVVNQQLTVDFIDVEKDDLVWQAVNQGEYKEKSSPIKKETYYLKVIQKILKKYPPIK